MAGMLIKNNDLPKPGVYTGGGMAGWAEGGITESLFPLTSAFRPNGFEPNAMNKDSDPCSRLLRSSCAAAQETAGLMLVIGPHPDSLNAIERLKNHYSFILLLDPMDSPDPAGAVTRITGGKGAMKLQVTARLGSLKGHLGRFSATVSGRHLTADLMYFATGRCEYIDLVLDLGDTARFPAESQPYGYFAARAGGSDSTALFQTLASLSGPIRGLKQVIP